jgi:hypothetical protein
MIYLDDHVQDALEKIARPSAGYIRALEALTGAGVGGAYGALSKPDSRNRETPLDRALLFGAMGAAGAPTLSALIRHARGTGSFRKKMKASGYTPGDEEKIIKALRQIEQEKKIPLQLVRQPGGGFGLKAGQRSPAELAAEMAHFARKGKAMAGPREEYRTAKSALEALQQKYMGVL